MTEPRPLAIVLDRTSGDEKNEGQDIRAQLAQTIHRATEAGFHVTASFPEEAVSGRTPWPQRPRLQTALRAALEHHAVLVVREISRLWRGHPAEGLQLLTTIPDLEVLGSPHYTRRDGAWIKNAPEDELVRFIGLWASWRELLTDLERSAYVMAEIEAGRRKTKSGKPPHRPPRELDPIGLQAAKDALTHGKSQLQIREAYRHATGFYRVTDPTARQRRDVSRTVLMQRLRAVGKPKQSESPHSISPNPPVGIGAVLDNTHEPP